MEIEIVNLVINCLSGDNSRVKSATESLSLLESRSTDSCDRLATVLLHLAFSSAHPLNVRQFASVQLKNVFKRRWVDQDAVGATGNVASTSTSSVTLSTGCKLRIKSDILTVSSSTAQPLPDILLVQLVACISAIAEFDFPSNWPEFLPSIVPLLASDFPFSEYSSRVLGAVLSKYETVGRSEAVLKELKELLPLLQEQHTRAFEAMSSRLAQSTGADDRSLKHLLTVVTELVKIFKALNSVDIPEFYEDHANDWMTRLSNVVVVCCGLMEKHVCQKQASELISSCFECFNLYASRYQEVFQQYVTPTVMAAWNTLNNAKLPKSDEFQVAGLALLASVAMTRWQSGSPFDQPDAILQVVQTLVFPALVLQESDIDLFSTDIADYMLRDLEDPLGGIFMGADALGSRRGGALLLLRSLIKHYEPQVIKAVGVCLSGLTVGTATDEKQIRLKEAAVSAVRTVASAAETRSEGVTKTTPHIEPSSFFEQYLACELISVTPKSPVLSQMLVCSIIKFLVAYQNFVSEPSLCRSLQSLCSRFAVSVSVGGSEDPSPVLSYVAYAFIHLKLSVMSGFVLSGPIDRIVLSLSNQMYCHRTQNEVVARGLLRLLECTRGHAANSNVLMAMACEASMRVLSQMSGSPGHPGFVRTIFDIITLFVSSAAPLSGPSGSPKSSLDPRHAQLISETFRVMFAIVEKQLVEYSPFAIQVIAQLVLCTGSQVAALPAIAQSRAHAFAMLKNQAFWSQGSCVAGELQLLTAFLSIGSHCPEFALGVATDDKRDFDAVMRFVSVIFSQAKSSAVDPLLFGVLSSCLCYMSPQALGASLRDLLMRSLSRIQQRKSPQIVRLFGLALCQGLLRFHKLGTSGQYIALIAQCAEGIQKGLAVQIFNELWLAGLKSVHDKRLAMRTCVVLLSTPTIVEAVPICRSAITLLASCVLGGSMANGVPAGGLNFIEGSWGAVADSDNLSLKHAFNPLDWEAWNVGTDPQWIEQAKLLVQRLKPQILSPAYASDPASAQAGRALAEWSHSAH